MKKRILAILLCLLLLMQTGAMVYAADDTRTVLQSGYCGREWKEHDEKPEDVTWTLYSDGELVISGTGYIEYYSKYSATKAAPWYSIRESIKTVTIESGVKNVGNHAFYRCSEITSVEIPNSVDWFGESAFSGCSGLTSVEIPNSVTYIGQSSFSGCSGLTSVEIPDSVTSIGRYAFSGCSGLTSVKISNSVTYIDEGAFSSCRGLTSVKIPNSVTWIDEEAFSGCSGLTSVEIPNRVSSIGKSAFRGCSGLTSVEIPDSVTYMGESAFYGCSGLTSLKISNRVTSISDTAFGGCSGLTSVEIPDSVTSIGKYAFGGCSGLTSVEIPKNVTSIGERVFNDCSGLTRITVAKGNKNYCADDDGVLFNIDKSELIKYPAGNERTEYLIPTSVNIIDDYAFSGSINLKGDLKIPNSVESIGAYSFENCGFDGSLILSDKLTSISTGAFEGCSNLTGNLVFPESVTIIDECAFWECSNLTGDLVIPETITEIWGLAFYGCSNLTGDLVVPETVTVLVGDAFTRCSKLTSVTILVQGTDFWYSWVDFECCDSLTYVKLPEGIEGGNFADCPNLKHIYFSGSYEDSQDAFNFYNIIWDTDENGEKIEVDWIPVDPENTFIHYDCNVREEHPYTLRKTISATCTEGGKEIWACDCGYEDERNITEKESDAHTWGDAEFTWSDDYTTCTATRICANNKEHIDNAKEVKITVSDEKPATCTEAANITHTAIATFESGATATGTREEVVGTAALGHDWGKANFEWSKDYESCEVTRTCERDNCDETQTEKARVSSQVTTSATCTENGVKTYTATVTFEGETESVEDTRTVSIKANGHSLSFVKATLSTCQTEGNDEYWDCSVCKKIFTDSEGTNETTLADVTRPINENNHPAESIKIDKAVPATCDEPGNTEGSHCEACKAVIVETKLIPAKGHKYEVTFEKDATCTENGSQTFTCQNDPTHTYTDPIVSKGHDYKLTDDKAVSCTEDGYETYTCSVCDHSYTDIIEATGHKHEIIKGYDATCTEDGKTNDDRCSVCGEVFTNQQVIPAKGHAWITVPAVEPTCESKGNTEGKKCARCGLVESVYREIAPLGHRFGETTVISDSTCSKDGVGEHTCLECGKTEKVVIPADDSKHIDSDHNGICDECHEDLTEDCDCYCHLRSKFDKIIWKFLKFLWKLFGIKNKQYCDCGVRHW